jgi:hypothetical protein
MNRRRYLLTAASGVSALLAGCVSDSEDEDTDAEDSETAEENDQDSQESTKTATATDEHPAVVVVDSYIEASAAEDLDRLATYMHSRHPYNPDNLGEEKRESIEFTYTDVEEYDIELLDEAFDTETLRTELSSAWFGNGGPTLAEVTEGEEAALVEVTYEQEGAVETKSEQIIVLTDDGQWRVFMPYEQSLQFPDEDDTAEYEVVERIEYNTENRQAKVYLSGTEEIGAQRVTVYSTSLGDQSHIRSKGSGTVPNVNYLAAPFDPDGDKLVVTVTVDGEERVVHREQYPSE